MTNVAEHKTQELWFLTGSQHLYGDETLEKVARNSQQIAEALDRSGKLPAKVVWKPVLTGPEAILNVCLAANAAPECAGVITWMHTFSPAKMWIAGLTRLQKPLAHLHTQYNRELPWGEIDMDFMNLNQSAHGDREYGFIGARLRLNRKIVVGHWQDPEVVEELAGWARAALAMAESRQLKIARFGGMNMREVAVTGGDRVEAQIQLGWSINGYGVGDLVARIAEVSDAEVDRLVTEYEDSYALSAPLKRGGEKHESLRSCGASGDRHARLPRGGRVRGLHHHLRGPARAEAAARPGLPAAHGGRLRLRRRGRLEDRRPGPPGQGDDGGPARRRVVHGGLHVPPGQGEGAGARRAHARGLPFDRRREAVARGPPARHRRQGRPGPAGLRRPARARR